jgi:hypothetical protein
MTISATKTVVKMVVLFSLVDINISEGCLVSKFRVKKIREGGPEQA